MLKQAFILVSFSMPVTLLLANSSEIDQTKAIFQTEKIGITQVQVEPIFEEFDEFDQAVEQAIDLGMLKTTPEMRQPSSAEVVARKAVAYMFMKYLWLREVVVQGYQHIQALMSYIWLRIHG